MAYVTLQGVYLAPVDDYSLQTVLNAGVQPLSDRSGVLGEFRRFDGGRVRLITQAGSERGLAVAVSYANRTTRELLDTWKGKTLLLRDGRGRLVFGSFLTLEVTEQVGLPYCDIAFEFVEITTSSEV